MNAREVMPPDLLELATSCRELFGAKMMFLEAQGQTFGQRPTWLDWPTVRLDQIGPAPRTTRELVRSTRTGRAA